MLRRQGWLTSSYQADENEHTGKMTLGLSVIVRVTLKDGTFHEVRASGYDYMPCCLTCPLSQDIGYGHIENCRGKAAAFEKAKKEGTTDALKRALRNFGNVLGNCVYDKDYLSKVTKVKSTPVSARASFNPVGLSADFDTGQVGRRGTPPSS